MKRQNGSDWRAIVQMGVLFWVIAGILIASGLAVQAAQATPTPSVVYLYRGYLPLVLKDDGPSPTPTPLPWPTQSPVVTTLSYQPTPAATNDEIDLMARTLACETEIFFNERGIAYGTGPADAIAIVQVFKRRHEISGKSWEEVLREGSACWTDEALPDYLVSRRDLFCESPSMSFQECQLMLEIAVGAMYGWYEDLMPGATHFYDAEKMTTPPTWADERYYVGSIGPHKYYRIWPGPGD
jgi:hypothetical protein